MPKQNIRSLIIGASGQDGTYLRELLKAQGHEIWNVNSTGLWREGETARRPFSLFDSALGDLFQEVPPDQLYYLAAYHQASQEKGSVAERDLWMKSLQVNFEGWVQCLLNVKEHSPRCHAVYASSSHIFGHTETDRQDEETPFRPANIYGISKVAGMNAARFYREVHGLAASCLILYNHESPLRSEKFVSQKIIKTLRQVRSGAQPELLLGDLEAVVDWGYAPDYVAAMRLVAALGQGDDYVVATGQPHRVRDFVSEVCRVLDLKMAEVVREDRSLLGANYRPLKLVGDAAKLSRVTGWKPSVTFAEMIRLLLGAGP